MYDHLRRGAVSGAVGGAVYGLYVALVGAPVVEHAEHLADHGAGAAGHDHAGAALGDGLAGAVSVGGSAALGLVAGLVVFGAVAYVVEPALPAVGGSYLLGLCGFLSASAVPWLVLPPAAPGVEPTVSATAGLALYAGLAVAGATACVTAGAAFHRLPGRAAGAVGAVAVFAAVVVGAVFLAPSVAYEGSVPAGLGTAYTGVVVAGQLLLWGAVATVHDRLRRRPRPTATAAPTAAD